MKIGFRSLSDQSQLRANRIEGKAWLGQDAVWVMPTAWLSGSQNTLRP